MKKMFAALGCGLLSFCMPMLAQAQVETRPDAMGIEYGTGQLICHNDGDERVQQMDESYMRSALWDRMVLGETETACRANARVPTAPASINDLPEIDGGTWAVSQRFSGTDNQGRHADFRLYVLNDRYSWKLNSTRQIEEGTQAANLLDLVGTPEFTERFCASKAVFSVGAASYEGPTEANRRLAGGRAVTVSNELETVRAGCPAGRIPLLFALNLGENQRVVSNSTVQRRLVIVAAEDLAVDVNLPQALQNALIDQRVIRGVDIREYDLFLVEAR